MSSTIQQKPQEKEQTYKDIPPKSKVYHHISKYATPDDLTALLTLLDSVIPLMVMYFGPWRWLFFVPVSLYRVRTFIIFHDACHHSYFNSKFLNYLASEITGIPLFTPRSYWLKGHNYHHKVSNNLDKGQYAQTAPWTKEKFNKSPYWVRCAYSIIYGPLTLWTFIPYVYFVIFQRFVCMWYENVVSLLWLGLLFYVGGLELVWYEFLSGVLTSLYGFFLFHVQHTFQGCYRARGDKWDYYRNGMQGSSYFNVPWPFNYFTLGIEFHHIHHLNTKVPSYKLRKCHEEAGKLFDCVPRLSLLDAFSTLHLSVYDESKQQFEVVYQTLFEGTPLPEKEKEE